MNLTTVHAINEDHQSVLACNLAAVYRIGDHGQLYALSVASSEREISAVATAIADRSASFKWPDLGIKRWETSVQPASGGFELRKAKLAYDQWHLVAVARDERFLLHETDEALWRVLRSDKFTTPLLRDWVPTIRHDLAAMNHLRKLDYFGPCSPAYLSANDDALDRVVSNGLRRGALSIEAQKEAA